MFCTTLLLLWGNQPPTVGAFRILVFVLFAIKVAPIVFQVFSHERLAAVGAARGYMIPVAVYMVGYSFIWHVLA
jgi:hypothetical protein